MNKSQKAFEDLMKGPAKIDEAVHICIRTFPYAEIIWQAAWQARGEFDAKICENKAGTESYDCSTSRYLAEDIRKADE